MTLSRRDFLKLTAAGIASAAVSDSVLADHVSLSQGAVAESGSWPLWMRRKKEEFRFDAATPEGFEVARHLLRDIEGGGVKGFPHLKLLQALSRAQQCFAYYGVHSCFDVFSGLRLPSTNSKTEGASKTSLHMPNSEGWFFAADIRPVGVGIEKAAGWMRYVGLSGIGLYSGSDFLHVDIGRPRVWRRTKAGK